MVSCTWKSLSCTGGIYYEKIISESKKSFIVRYLPSILSLEDEWRLEIVLDFLRDWNISSHCRSGTRYSGTRGSFKPCNVTRILRISFPLSIFHRDQSMIQPCLVNWTSCCRYLCSSSSFSSVPMKLEKEIKFTIPVAKWPIRFQRERGPHPLGGSDALTRSIFTLVDRFSKFFN